LREERVEEARHGKRWHIAIGFTHDNEGLSVGVAGLLSFPS
jgi:hypothetical protein